MPDTLYIVLGEGGRPIAPTAYRTRADALNAATLYRADGIAAFSYALIVKEPRPDDQVAVAFKEFDSPSAAAEYGELGNTFTYAADPDLKLTIGDRVRVPVGKYDERIATVVALNAECPVDYIKRVICRGEWP